MVSTGAIDSLVAARREIFGEKVPLPAADPTFDFAIREDGSLPLDGAAPSIIDRRGRSEPPASLPDLGARLRALVLEHPDPALIDRLYREVGIDRPPAVVPGGIIRYRAQIETSTGLKELS